LENQEDKKAWEKAFGKPQVIKKALKKTKEFRGKPWKSLNKLTIKANCGRKF
jgi:hypothetical protein